MSEARGGRPSIHDGCRRPRHRLRQLAAAAVLAALPPLPALAADPFATPPGPSAPNPSAPNPSVLGPAARVFIHYSGPSQQGRQLAAEAALVLSNAGYEVVELRAVDIVVSRPRVRYFFAADASRARAIAERFGRYLAQATSEGGAVEVEDFTRFRPLPSPGNIEVWIPSKARAAVP